MILGFGGYDTAKHPRVGIILDGLAAHGYEVREINHPLGFSTAERVRMLKQPWRLPQFGLRLIKSWRRMARDARKLKRNHAMIDAVVVGYMGHFDVLLARRVFRGTPIVLDHLIFAGDTAKDRGTQGLRARLLSWLDRQAIAAADIVAVDTNEHLQMLPEGVRGVVVPVGARQEWFEARRREEAQADDSELSVIFFGLFTPLQGAPVMAEGIRLAIAGGASLRATIVGRGQDHAQVVEILRDTPRIEWREWVEPHELPQLVADHDVCLGIFASTPKAVRVVPNKVYEGIAAGCAVVTSDSEPQKRMLGDLLVQVPAANALALSEKLAELSRDRELLNRVRSHSRAGSMSVAAPAIVKPLLEILNEGNGLSESKGK